MSPGKERATRRKRGVGYANSSIEEDLQTIVEAEDEEDSVV